MFVFTPNLLEISHLWLHNWGSKIMITSFLLKKIINPTLYSPILYFIKENNPSMQPHAFIIPYEVGKSP